MRIVRNKVVLIIEYFEKLEDNKIIRIDQNIVNITGREFVKSLEEAKEAGIEYQYEYVNAKPEKFQFGKLYILKGSGIRPDMVYSFQLNG